MGRMHHWQDRAQLVRVRKKVNRGEVSGEAPVFVGAPIPCVLITPRGDEDLQGARTYLAENSVLHFMKVDEGGIAVSVKQGDTVILSYMQDGVRVGKAKQLKIIGDIRQNRRGREVVSLSAEVRMDTEH